MKKINVIVNVALILLVSIVVVSCNCIIGNGEIVKEKRDVGTFTSIVLKMGGDLYLKQDTTTTLSIEAQENLLEHIVTRISGKKLIIDFKSGCYKSDGPVNFYITLPELSEVQVNGSGNIKGKGVFNLEDIGLKINGSGNVNMDIVANRIDISINGSGSVFLDGTSQKLKASISGSGEIYAEDHTSYKAYISVTGSGSCEVYAHDLLDVSITGSGDVSYFGNPELRTHVTGSGSVRKKH